MKVIIDREQCTGIGNCAVLAPAVFKLDKSNKATVLNVKADSEAKIREAAENCSMAAIILQDDNGKQIFP